MGETGEHFLVNFFNLGNIIGFVTPILLNQEDVWFYFQKSENVGKRTLNVVITDS